MVADLQKRRSGDDRSASRLQAILVDAYGDGRLPEEDAEAAHTVLESAQFRSWPGKARDLLGAYEADGDAARLAEDIRKFGRSIYAEDREGGDAAVGSAGARGAEGDGDGGGGAARLVLIGAQFVMDEYDPGLGQKGLERHME